MPSNLSPNLKALLHLYEIEEDIGTGAGVGTFTNWLKANGGISMAKSLMIVDDSATMRKIIMRTIRMSGLEFDKTEEAGNGAEALEKLQAAPVDVVLCDVNMPEMNGTELVKEVRKISACDGTKIIMVSTESSEDLINGVIADGANGFITKPFTPEKFQQELAPLVS